MSTTAMATAPATKRWCEWQSSSVVPCARRTSRFASVVTSSCCYSPLQTPKPPAPAPRRASPRSRPRTGIRSGPGCGVTASLGLAWGDPRQLEDLSTAGDAALYRAKTKGGNQTSADHSSETSAQSAALDSNERPLLAHGSGRTSDTSTRKPTAPPPAVHRDETHNHRV